MIAPPPDQKPIILLPTISPDHLLIHVAGEVQQPGVITLEIDSRVIDAIEAAGGFTSNAATQGLNLARILVDGEYLLIPTKEHDPKNFSNSESPPSDLGNTILININTASVEALDQLPGTGTAKAKT